MLLKDLFSMELQHEAGLTKKMLERVPEAHADWKPHEKSMSLTRLASHLPDLFTWVNATLMADELDFSKVDFKPQFFAKPEELCALLEKNLNSALDCLKNTSEEEFSKIWTLRNGEQIFFQLPKMVVIRNMVLNHLVHHRGQLSVYLRLLNVPLPGLYGPTADEA